MAVEAFVCQRVNGDVPKQKVWQQALVSRQGERLPREGRCERGNLILSGSTLQAQPFGTISILPSRSPAAAAATASLIWLMS